MQAMDPESGLIVATDAAGNLYCRENIPGFKVITLGDYPNWGAGNTLNPCVGIVFEKGAGESTYGYTYFTAPVNGKGGFGPYDTWHIPRLGFASAEDAAAVYDGVVAARV